jgi:hypothetical protein
MSYAIRRRKAIETLERPAGVAALGDGIRSVRLLV